ncbi:MAG: L-serine ammonia-lyase, iron-sulfur-dependent, subunit alpha [Synergistes sp.]|nr:L-serine ammonia-lyase, iron-sulfur-dependent, subunit alpha [Synergistes sp.]
MPISIFNDVIGPVMRGPSSSHTAASFRIAFAVRASVGDVSRVVCDFDTNGSLAATHKGQGTDMGFTCGLIGIDLTDEKVKDYEDLAKNTGIDVTFRILDYGAIHPNTYRIDAIGKSGTHHTWEGISTGGGMIEMQKFDGFSISLSGDFYELLITAQADKADKLRETSASVHPDFVLESENNGKILFEMKFSNKNDADSAVKIANKNGLTDVAYIPAFLPTLSRASCSVPFETASEMLAYNESKNLPLWELAAEYEAQRGGTSKEKVLQNATALLAVMEHALDEGLAGTEYKDRILGRQSDRIEKAERSGTLIPCSIVNGIIKSITAIMETKSAMGVIIAAPTAGSCGCLPGTLIGAARIMGKSREETAKALLAAGLIGIFFAKGATFAAEVGGCQMECGAGSGMAAAGLVQLMGGTAVQCADAASIALQNITGLVCDTVADRVEVPCLGKNIMAGTNAIAAANMALAGYDKVIPLDETIAAMLDIGHKLPAELRCTFGGLGKTPTALKIAEELKSR